MSGQHDHARNGAADTHDRGAARRNRASRGLEARGRGGDACAALRPGRPDQPERADRLGQGRRVHAHRHRLRAAGQDDRRRPAAGRADADRRGPGRRQDDHGAADGPQHGRIGPGDRPLRVLRARGGVPDPAADRHGVGAHPPAAEVGRREDPGRQERGPGLLHRRRGDGHSRQAGHQPPPAPQSGAHRALRQQPLPAARHGHQLHGRQHARRWSTSIAAPTTSGAWSSSSTTSRRCRSSRSRTRRRRR